jgi:hypothetical protein
MRDPEECLQNMHRFYMSELPISKFYYYYSQFCFDMTLSNLVKLFSITSTNLLFWFLCYLDNDGRVFHVYA